MKKIILSIEGMTCSACSSGLEKYLNKQKYIEDANVNLVMATAQITYDEKLEIEDLNRFISEAGFKSLGEYDEHKRIKEHKNAKKVLVLFTILTLIMMYVSMGHMINLPSIPFLNPDIKPKNYAIFLMVLAVIFLIYGFDILRNGYKNLIHKTPNMDTLVGIGVIASFLYSLFGLIMIFKGYNEYIHSLYFESVTTVIYFIKLGRFIDSKSKDKTKEAINKLALITPESALALIDGKEKEISIDEIMPKMILIAKPGMKIAADGVIKKGETHLDESFVTGESIPVKKTINDQVIAGSINYDGYITYEALKIGRDSTISEIVKLVLEATNSKAPIAKYADVVSGYFVPFVLVIAILSLIINLILGVTLNETINIFVSVLVVACPCALGLATPLALVVSEGLCASRGILIKKSETLELLSKVDTVVFDKTGTLTYGNLKIANIYNYSDESDDKILSKASSIEEFSTHPISKAFINYALEHKLKKYEVDGFKSIEGYGLYGKINGKDIYLGNAKLLKKLKIKNSHESDEEVLLNKASSIIYIVIDKKIQALIGVNDVLRKEASSMVSTLQQNGKKVIMLTGDNEVTASSIASMVGIKNVYANVLPKEKVNIIKKLKKQGHVVMMVGDGINDAPSLASADIGVSIKKATDIAIDSAKIILLNDDLDKINDLFKISNMTMKNIKENLFWAFFYNILMIPIALGFFKKFNIYLNPMLASIAMMFSSLTVLFNALRLKTIKFSRKEEIDNV